MVSQTSKLIEQTAKKYERRGSTISDDDMSRIDAALDQLYEDREEISASQQLLQNLENGMAEPESSSAILSSVLSEEIQKKSNVRGERRAKQKAMDVLAPKKPIRKKNNNSTWLWGR